MKVNRSPLYHAFVQHERALKRFIGRFLRNRQDIEDVAQETFLRAYSTGRDIEQPKSFLFRIARNTALNQIARKSNQVTDYLEDSGLMDVIGESTSEEEVAAAQVLGLHCEAVASLPLQCRRVYLMRKVYGMTHKEIAERLGIAVSTVEKHLIKAVADCDRYVRERVDSDGSTRTNAARGLRSGGRS